MLRVYTAFPLSTKRGELHWPADEESLKHVPTPGNIHSYETPETTAILQRVAGEMKFFHWEVEFPDVFTKERHGFDALLGNPPWDAMKPKSQEFFTEFDPLYRTYDKQAALRRQKDLFDTVPGLRDHWDEYNARFKGLSNWAGKVTEPFDVALTRGSEEKSLKAAWEKHRQQHIGFADPDHPFQLQGSADLNSYKMFIEVCWHLLRHSGRMGIIVPSGIYSDSGTKTLRETLLKHAWEWLFCFENKNKIFDIHRSFKFAPVVVSKRLSRQRLNAAFMVHDLRDWDRDDPPTFELDPAAVDLFSPRSKSLPEVRGERDFQIARTIYDHSFRIGDNAPGWEISYATEFHMTNDSKHFPPLAKWEEKGFKPDVFGRWIGPGGDVALPLYEGRMIGLFDFSEKGWVEGKGRSAVWRDLPFDAKTVQPQFLIAELTFRNWERRTKGRRLGFMSIGSGTNARTGIATALNEVPCGNSVSVLAIADGDLSKTFYLAACVSSLGFV